MNLGPATKLQKEQYGNVKKIDDDVMSGNCDVIVFFLICSHPKAGFGMHGL